MIPLYHDFSEETVLVFGGGSVGARKARRFAREATVVVVSPTFDDRFEEFDESEQAAVDRIRAAPEPEAVGEWLDRFEPAMVVAATDHTELNRAVGEAADERGLLINRTDRSGSRDVGSVVVPATVRDGPVSVAVSTGGKSPALSRYLRQQIETEIQDAGAMAELTGELRSEIKESDYSAADRRAAVRSVVRSSSVWKALHTGTPNAEKEAERVMAAEHDDKGASR
ncbi:precorrin-2 dehydrogenase/sirohydrochlorin ferrochelatase family protein [Halohasta litorea]|uniref:precorrin-2 dehydrogenase n=1 Tax=Halohasta litorea TaxID=869891 RepID=A0ABD6D847_9EURY|nr:bifunctional precorrin-2 dehydrogenase/sirohydrochlorin ferrochelatase [Halohasta litorea]